MKTPKKRGSTMLEALVAGAILVVGLTGVIAMLLKTAGETRDGVAALSASSFANSSVDEVLALGMGNIPLGTSDAGFVYDAQDRKYGRIITAVAGGTALVPTVDVSVRVEWRDSNGVTRVTTANTIISSPPDAG